MNFVQIIEKKSKGLSISEKEINFFINGVVDNSIPDYQISALLMAIKINGFNDKEIVFYARGLVNSGKILPLNKDLVDKHSTGGVGDKTSISLLPILGSMGLKVFKISGRGLGFTGGTIDKLESLTNFNGELSIDDVNKMVSKIGISITGQTPDLTPADGKIYAIRDITGTVESPELIAASIISKKIASGAKNILIDLKVGSGSFTSGLKEANELARLMKLIAKDFNRNLFVLFSSMDQPLGRSVGNKIEVIEAVDFLKQGTKKEDDFYDLIKKISTELYSKSKNTSIQKAEEVFDNVIESGKAFELQKLWFRTQGATNLDRDLIFSPSHKMVINSDFDGIVSFANVKNLGNALIQLKAGRKFKGDNLDFDSGIKFLIKNGEKAIKGKPLFEVFSSKEISEDVINQIKSNFLFNKKTSLNNVILGEVSW